MITRQMLREIIYPMSTEGEMALDKAELSITDGILIGFLFGCCLAAKNSDVAKKVDQSIRVEWALDVGSPGGDYGYDRMAVLMLQALERANGKG